MQCVTRPGCSDVSPQSAPLFVIHSGKSANPDGVYALHYLQLQLCDAADVCGARCLTVPAAPTVNTKGERTAGAGSHSPALGRQALTACTRVGSATARHAAAARNLEQDSLRRALKDDAAGAPVTRQQLRRVFAAGAKGL